MSNTNEAQRVCAALAAEVNEGLWRSSAYTVLFNQAVAERLGINATDLRCFDLISRLGPLTAGQLAELTALTSGAITGVLDRLEEAGLAERRADRHDRRRVIVSVAEGAGGTVGPLFGSVAQAMDELCARYSPDELAVILDFVNQLEPVMRRETAKMRAGNASAGQPRAEP